MTDFVDMFAVIVENFSNFYTNITDITILDVPLLYLLLGASVLVYIAWVITKWIIDL